MLIEIRKKKQNTNRINLSFCMMQSLDYSAALLTHDIVQLVLINDLLLEISRMDRMLSAIVTGVSTNVSP